MKCRKADSLLHALVEHLHFNGAVEFGPVSIEAVIPPDLALRLFMFDFDGDCDLECCDALEVEHLEE